MTVIKVHTGTQLIALTSQSIKQTELINQLITVDSLIRTNYTKGPWPSMAHVRSGVPCLTAVT